MRIFKTKVFDKWAKGLLSNNSLFVAANEIVVGNFDASLGQKIYKKRIAITGKGKSGGTRTIVAYQEGNNLFYVTGFSKSNKTNLTQIEKTALQAAAKIYLGFSTKDLNKQYKQIFL